MSLPGPPAVDELLAWAQAPARDPKTKRARVPLLLSPWLPWLDCLPVIKVAGTNGKGSVSAMLSAVLRRAGHRPGLFTSPHLARVHERFRVDEREPDSETLERHAARVLHHARALVARHGEALRPSFFEALLALALDLFREAGADALVIEAGVGGAHDATSLLPGTLGAITSIGLDHQDVLGAGLEAIAADKAGIVGPGAHLVLGPRIPPALRAHIAAHAPGVTLSTARADELRASFRGARPTRVELDRDDGPLALDLPLLGAHQIDNLATVVALARQLVARGVLSDLRALAGVAEARWPGRLEVRPGTPRVVLDAAHNPEGLAALADALDDLAPRAERLLAFGLASGKDTAACLAFVPRLAPAVLLVDGFYRARAAVELRAALPAQVACLGFATPAELARRLDRGEITPTTTVVVAGSIFLIGALRAALDEAREP